jgi:vancomycin resistance protein YoaR
MVLQNTHGKLARGAALVMLPLSLAVYFVVTFPFADTLASKFCSLRDLSKEQRSNIRIAAHAVNEVVLKPGDEFSFNRIVGPRTEGRGYKAAPSYLETGSPATIGGGICLLSSAIYQSALESGCKITERTAHTRTIRSVPPGLDSTVWFGQVDLKFRNPYPEPIQISTEWSPGQLKVRILGKKSDKVKTGHLQTLISNSNHNEIVVEVVRSSGNTEFISRDHYRVTR